jgi:hypothetical protein
VPLERFIAHAGTERKTSHRPVRAIDSEAVVVRRLLPNDPIPPLGHGSHPAVSLPDHRLSQFQWLYHEHSQADSQQPSFFVACSGGELLGHIGAIPTRVLVNGKSLSALYPADLHVSGRSRRSGVASRLLRHLESESDLIALLGMTPAAERLYRHLGYIDAGKLVPLFRVLKPDAFLTDMAMHTSSGVAHRASTWRIVQGTIASIAAHSPKREHPREASGGAREEALQVTTHRPCPEDLDALWAAVAATHRIIAERSAGTLKWRVWDSPCGPYDECYLYRDKRLAGFAILKRYTTAEAVRVGVVVDLLCANGDAAAFGALIREALSRFAADGVDYAKASFSSPWARRRCRQHGFLDPTLLLPGRFTPGSRLMLAGHQAARVKSLHSIRNWWLTRLDGEQDLSDMLPGAVTV